MKNKTSTINKTAKNPKGCKLCGKGISSAGKYSNRVRATQFNPTGTRRIRPNLQWAALPAGGRIKVCTSCKKKGKNLK